MKQQTPREFVRTCMKTYIGSGKVYKVANRLNREIYVHENSLTMMSEANDQGQRLNWDISTKLADPENRVLDGAEVPREDIIDPMRLLLLNQDYDTIILQMESDEGEYLARIHFRPDQAPVVDNRFRSFQTERLGDVATATRIRESGNDNEVLISKMVSLYAKGH